MTDFIYEDAFDPDVNIKVIGVGGGGGNALNCMASSDVHDIEYIAVNTDAKALNNSKATTKIQIGAKLTKGRGAGNKPEVGEKSAEENRDEIEAALDEANVSRYANYLHKLTKNTQFIIITHRRGTMAAADRLYGITMQEKGVSTLVSVNLIEEELEQ